MRNKTKIVGILIVVLIGSISGLVAANTWLPPQKYGQQFTLYFNVYDSNSPWRFYETAPAAADIHIIKNGGAAANPTNSVTDLGKTFSLVLTATEMQAAVVIVEVNDISAPKLYMDNSWYIPTSGNASALNAFDLDKDFQDSMRFGLKAATGLSDPNANSLVDMMQDLNDITELTGIIARDPNDEYFAGHTEFNTFIGSAMTSTDVQNDMRNVLKSSTGLSDPNTDSPIDILQDVNGIMSTLGILARDPNNEYAATHAEISTLSSLVEQVLWAVSMQQTTIANLVSQTSFSLMAGSSDDDAYNGRIIIIKDASTSTQIAIGQISDYTGNTKVIELSADPGIFTMAQNDGIIILPIPPSSITAGDLTDIASAVLDVAAANHNADGTIGRKIQEPKRGY